ncbi:cupin domain-containing protein [Rhodococcus chondri]|uniref:Cupin domain-containing protein n=1 Tax=Rhodococcus chondri TaxID=3065941 RepID=A0ABU7JXU6_9NOCA|nr:cupin domain-containing protein [Rhodococcus sp. CC-R104]MEE2034612.1 cupin domain-containing protein [Rhodococcus sp. CC-R104]
MSAEEASDGKMTVIEGLADLNAQDGDTPRLEKLATGAGATVIRMGFAAGQVMKDHRAPAPILVQATSGDVSFSTADRTVSLVPGTAVHVDTGIVHKLVANTDSVVMLTILR